MSLRTGTEMITLSVLLNKVTGFYGLLSIFTGVSLSPTQLSMYLYSVCALVLCCYLFTHIRKTAPLQNLALAYFYLFDTLINTAYTAAFAMTWFLTVSAKHTGQEIPESPGKGTIDDTAGFTDPKYNVSSVDVVIDPTNGQSTVGIAAGAGASMINAATGSPSLGHGVSLTESFPSLLVLVALSLIRVYCIFVIFAYARQVLRQYMSQHQPSTTTSALQIQTDSVSAERQAAGSSEPFSVDTQEGQGWKGKLGRAMVNLGRSYWIGGKEDDLWAKGLDGRFRMATTKVPRNNSLPGTVERERRARSGTGPSSKPPTIPNLKP